MGSIISFPFLCIANAAMCRYSMEQSNLCMYRVTDQGGRRLGRLAPLLINGDDCLLRVHKYLGREFWEAATSVGGLESSVGKTYFSDQFCTINSTIFDLKEGSWVESKYVNLGLMLGRSRVFKVNARRRPEILAELAGLHSEKKKKGKGNRNTTKVVQMLKAELAAMDPDIQVHQMGVISRELKRSCPPSMWLDVKRRFIYHNMEILNRAKGIPWFVPEWLGGLGLPFDQESERDDTTRKCCSVIRSGLARSDKNYVIASPEKSDEWQMHVLVMKYLKEQRAEEPVPFRHMNIDNNTVLLDEEFRTLYKYATLNLLQTTSLQALCASQDINKNRRKALLRNVDTWSNARKAIGVCNLLPMGDEDMQYENKHFVTPCVGQAFAQKFDLY